MSYLGGRQPEQTLGGNLERDETLPTFRSRRHFRVRGRTMPHITNDMRECITKCQDCASICIETITHCLTKGGKHAEAGHIGLLANCADICATSAKFLLRGSEPHTRTCEVCAEVCDACAKSCEALGQDDFMKRCEEACRSCAESCREMARQRKAA